MNGRRDRILIPSAVTLIAISVTLLLSSGDPMSPTNWFHDQSCLKLDFLINAGVVTLGIGYLCSAFFTLRMLSSEKCRLIDFPKLISAFGLVRTEELTWRECRQLEKQLLNEFHLRLHSHAPQSLIDHCSRRNTAWYVAKTSAVASFMGWFVGVIIFATFWRADTTTCEEVIGVITSFVIFGVVIPLALCWQGTKWNLEFWGVCWKWIGWDRELHPIPRNWVERLPHGVQWVSESKSEG